MPILSQGDIFELAPNVQFAIVFGHVGFNLMRQRWVTFRDANHVLHHVDNPFADAGIGPIEWQAGHWIRFIPTEENHGISAENLQAILTNALNWAQQKGLRVIATNGAPDTNHGPIAEDNRAMDDQRAQWLIQVATNAEVQYGLQIHLRSLNDVFVRNQ